MANEAIVIEGDYILNNLEVINRHFPQILGGVVDPILKKHLRSFMNTQSDMKQPPGPVARPIDWETPKQERWARWALSQGILPSRRSGELYRHFDVLADRSQYSAQIVNTSDYAVYVIGNRQQRFHKNTGYKKLDTYSDSMMSSSIPVVTKGLESEIKKFLFKKGLRG